MRYSSAELRVVQPLVLVCRGATAARSRFVADLWRVREVLEAA